jgi:hypothetical protein
MQHRLAAEEMARWIMFPVMRAQPSDATQISGRGAGSLDAELRLLRAVYGWM